MKPSLAVILPAAGMSSRFGGSVNKLFHPLGNQTILERSLAAFTKRAATDVRQIIIPTRLQPDANADVDFKNILARNPAGLIRIVSGGRCRAESVWNALKAVDAEIEWVAVHDAARPLISQELISQVFAAAREHGAAAPALPVQLTIKQANAPLPAAVRKTVPRHQLWAMQTPQIARREALLRAFENCPIPLEEVTDDLQLIELQHQPVWLVPGEEQNLKITTALDLKLATLILENPTGDDER